MYKCKKSKKVKVRYYIAQYLILEITQSALHFTPWQTCSIEHHLGFSWFKSGRRGRPFHNVQTVTLCTSNMKDYTTGSDRALRSLKCCLSKFHGTLSSDAFPCQICIKQREFLQNMEVITEEHRFLAYLRIIYVLYQYFDSLAHYSAMYSGIPTFYFIMLPESHSYSDISNVLSIYHTIC